MNRTTRHTVIAFATALLLAPLAALHAADAPKFIAGDKPNVIVIITDEQNFRTLGCYRALLPKDQAFIWGDGVAVETPHLDSIARNGLLCDRFYAASPVCTPSRSSFFSGRYPQNTGAPINDKPMNSDVVTFGEVLRRQGYATGYGVTSDDETLRPLRSLIICRTTTLPKAKVYSAN